MTVRGILTIYAGTALLLAVLLLVGGSLDHRYPLPLEEDFSTVVTDASGQPLRSFTNSVSSGAILFLTVSLGITIKRC
ncbi:hypothetical protein [Aliamphritea spongicola]|nr:hypothetical protein [Aliamphritea spongicola]